MSVSQSAALTVSLQGVAECPEQSHSLFLFVLFFIPRAKPFSRHNVDARANAHGLCDRWDEQAVDKGTKHIRQEDA